MIRGRRDSLICLLPLVLLAAVSGCARLKGNAGTPVSIPAEDAAPADESSASFHLPGNGSTNGTNRFVINTNRVLALQTEQIQAACRDENGEIAPARNRFTRWLDRTHDSIFRRLDNAVRRVDTMWLTEDIHPYSYELSTFKLRLLTRIGGRSNEGNSEYKVRFRADLALPGLERKLHVFLDNAGRDALPGQDPMEREDDTRLGVRTLWKNLRHSPLSLGGGVRFQSAKPVAYADIETEWKRSAFGGMLRLAPRGFWYDNVDGLGQTTVLTWTRQLDERKWFQIRTAERSTENTDGLEMEQTFRFASLRVRQGRGWVAQASAFPHYKHSEWKLDDLMVNFTRRAPLYRNWIFYTLTPQVDFPREDDYQPRPSLRIGLEILLGGEIGDLL